MRRSFVLVAVLLLACTFGSSQSGIAPQTAAGPRASRRIRPVDPQFGQRRNEDEQTERRMEREREKQIKKERQVKIKRDTDKLLALATELKQYVDKGNENLLSVDVIRKAEEIEKLAKQVKARMKD